MGILDTPELLIEDQVWLNYLWDFKTRGIDLDVMNRLSENWLATMAVTTLWQLEVTPVWCHQSNCIAL